MQRLWRQIPSALKAGPAAGYEAVETRVPSPSHCSRSTERKRPGTPTDSPRPAGAPPEPPAAAPPPPAGRRRTDAPRHRWRKSSQHAVKSWSCAPWCGTPVAQQDYLTAAGSDVAGGGAASCWRCSSCSLKKKRIHKTNSRLRAELYGQKSRQRQRVASAPPFGPPASATAAPAVPHETFGQSGEASPAGTNRKHTQLQGSS